jgi:hypothetical protein
LCVHVLRPPRVGIAYYSSGIELLQRVPREGGVERARKAAAGGSGCCLTAQEKEKFCRKSKKEVVIFTLFIGNQSDLYCDDAQLVENVTNTKSTRPRAFSAPSMSFGAGLALDALNEERENAKEPEPDRRKAFQNIKKKSASKLEEEKQEEIEMSAVLPTSDTKKNLLMQMNSFKRRQRNGSGGGGGNPAVAMQVAAALAQIPALNALPQQPPPPPVFPETTKRKQKHIVFRKHVVKVVKIVENRRKRDKRANGACGSDSATPPSITGMLSLKGDGVDPNALDALIGLSEQLNIVIKLLQERSVSTAECSYTPDMDDKSQRLSSENLSTRYTNGRPPKGGSATKIMTTPSRDSETSEASRVDRTTSPSMIEKFGILRKSSSKSNYCSVGSDDENETGGAV